MVITFKYIKLKIGKIVKKLAGFFWLLMNNSNIKDIIKYNFSRQSTLKIS